MSETNYNLLAEQTAMNLSAVSKQMGIITSMVQDHEISINRHDDDISKIKKYIKENETITPHQVQELSECLHNRVADLLKSADDENAIFEYYGAFSRKCWNDAKKHSKVLGRAGVYTKTVDFDDVKDYIGSWKPHGYSVEGYIDHLYLLRKK